MTLSPSPDLVRPRTAPDEPLLRVDSLHVAVAGGQVPAVRDVSFEVARGETVGLVGESGSGKTLTCRAALGVLAPGVVVTGGSISYGESDLTALDRAEWDAIRGSRIGAVFQDPASYLNPSLSIGAQLIEQLRVKRGLGRAAARARASELLVAMGIHAPELVLTQYPHELSGGMLQRVLLAIAVSCEPELLVADEATTALDVAIQAEVLELLRDLRETRGLSILLVSHDLAVIAEVCDRVLVFYAGEVVESGPTDEVLRRPRHPYTEALMRVATVDDWSRRHLDVIPGQPPAVGAALPGCRFADRCGFAVAACRVAPVPLQKTRDGREVRCIRADELDLAGGTA